MAERILFICPLVQVLTASGEFFGGTSKCYVYLQYRDIVGFLQSQTTDYAIETSFHSADDVKIP
jgi:hypothetical protein